MHDTYFSLPQDKYPRLAILFKNGELDGKCILSRKTIELMRSNSIGDIMVSDQFRRNGLGDKFGYGFGIRTERGVFDELESVGTMDGTEPSIPVSGLIRRRI
jgi:hypothetical protein